MSFQWQDRDAAARTLGVDTQTLQAWIDDGRAPSRTHQNKVQVLIELLDDEDTDAADAANSSDAVKAADTTAKSTSNKSAQSPKPEPAHEAASNAGDLLDDEQAPRAQRVHAQQTATDIELVSKREIQMAGGMVAAWQRLAETSNQDLARARKVGTLSWSLVAVLLIAGGIGLWATTREVTDTQGKLQATESKLTDVQRTAKETADHARALQAEVDQRNKDLADANSKLAATVERANLTESQTQAFAAQHLLTKQLADKQIETARMLAAALQSTIDQHKARIDELSRDLTAARESNSLLTARLTTSEKESAARKVSLEEITRERDSLVTQIESLTADHSKATQQIDDLKKQVSLIQLQLEKLKNPSTATAEKTGG